MLVYSVGLGISIGSSNVWILLVLGIGPYAGTKGWGEIHEGIKGLFIVALIFLLIVWIPSLLFGWGLVSEPIYNVLSDTINKILNFKP
ncbi:MAG: hypothetical protein QW360_02815 [Thermofilum sp.]